MAIESWTDVDYAQAAIDMLPGSVEEIEEFLKAQGIKSKWVDMECPLARWVEKWTDYGVGVGWKKINVNVEELDLPIPAQDYILYVENL